MGAGATGLSASKKHFNVGRHVDDISSAIKILLL